MSAKRFAVLNDVHVINVIVADAHFVALHYPTALECAKEVSVGWCYDGDKFYLPVNEVETNVNLS